MAEIIIQDLVGGVTSTVRSGSFNDAQGTCSTVFGGRQNDISSPISIEAESSTIFGGQKNTTLAPSCYTTIFGGQCNTAKQTLGVIGGGSLNTIFNTSFHTNNQASTIGGGQKNTLDGCAASIGGGTLHCINTSGNFSTIFGGRHNLNQEDSSTILGGWYNQNSSAKCSTISGGYDNCNLKDFSSIGGGVGNTSCILGGFVGGGQNNKVNQVGVSDVSSIFGGNGNVTLNSGSVILGGESNQNNKLSSIGAGLGNVVASSGSTIVGGVRNLINNSNSSVILGGKTNKICSTDSNLSCSSILGGSNNSIGNSKLSAVVGTGNQITDPESCGLFIISTNSNGGVPTRIRSAILGGENITATDDNSVFVPFLNINNLGANSAIYNLGIDAEGFVTIGEDPDVINIIAARGKDRIYSPIISNPATLEFSNIFQGGVMYNLERYDDWETSGVGDTYNPDTGIWTCPTTGLYNISYSVYLNQCTEISSGPWSPQYGNKIQPPITQGFCANQGLGWGLDDYYVNTGWVCFCPANYEPTPDGQACQQINVAPLITANVVPLSTGSNFSNYWGAFGVRIFKPNSWDSNGYPLSGVTPNGVGEYYNQIPSGGTATNPVWIHNFCTSAQGNYPDGCSYDFYVYCGPQIGGETFNTTYTNANGNVVNYVSQCNVGQPGRVWRERLRTVDVWKTNDQNWVGTLCLCDTFNVPTSKVYYIGIAGDNRFNVEVNGVPFISFLGDEFGLQSNHKWWNIYPIFLESGMNTIYMCNTNLGAIGALGCEIYDMSLAELTAVTSAQDFNLIYSSSEYHPGGPRFGQTSCPFSGCPTGYQAILTDEGYICGQILYTACTMTLSPNTTVYSSLGMISAGITNPDNTKLYVGSHITPKMYTKEAHLSGGQVNVLLNQGDQLCLRVNNTTGVPYTPTNYISNTDYTAMTIQKVKEVPPSPTPTQTPTPTPTPTQTPTPTPTSTPVGECGLSGYSYNPDGYPTPTPSTSASLYQFGCTTLFGDGINDEYFYFGGVRNGKPYFLSDGITYNITSCGSQQTTPPMTIYWDNTNSLWKMVITSNEIVCGTLTGSLDPNFPVTSNLVNWVSVNTNGGCPCSSVYGLSNTFGSNPCAGRVRVSSGTTFTDIQSICGSSNFFVNGSSTYLYAYTLNQNGTPTINVVSVGTDWYLDSGLSIPLPDGYYMLQPIVIASSNSRYWIRIQGGVITQNGVC